MNITDILKNPSRNINQEISQTLYDDLFCRFLDMGLDLTAAADKADQELLALLETDPLEEKSPF